MDPFWSDTIERSIGLEIPTSSYFFSLARCFTGEKYEMRSYEARFMPATGKWLYPAPDCPQGGEGRGCSNEADLWSHFTHGNPHGTV